MRPGGGRRSTRPRCRWWSAPAAARPATPSRCSTSCIGGAGPEGVTYALATGLLGFTPETLLDEVVDAFAADDGATVFGVVDKVIETGQDPRRFTEDLLRRLRDLVIIAAVPDAPATGLIDVPEDQAERLVAQAARFGRADLSRAADLVATGLTELKGATAPAAAARADLRAGAAARRRPQHRGRDGPPRPAREADVDRGHPLGRPRPRRPPRCPRRSPARGRRGPRARPGPSPSRPRPRPAPTPATVEPPAAVSAPEPAPARPPRPSPRPSRSPSRSRRPPRHRPRAAEPAAATAGGLTLVDVRRLWPDLLESVKTKRRFTWILLSQNAQVAAVDDKTLTVALVNAGARQSFSSGGSEEILRQAAIDVIGHDWRIEAIVDPTAQPGAHGDTVTRSAVATPEPAAEPAPEPPPAAARPPTAPPAPERRPVDPQAVASARGAIQETRRRARAAAALQEPSVSDDDAHPDDPDADDDLGGTELLERELGASIIEEIKHD